MKLLSLEEFLLEYVDYKPVKDVMPAKKFKHSKRVGELTKLIKDDEDVYSAAIYHDFLERGDDLEDMGLILKPHALELVEALTNYDNEEPIKKLREGIIGRDNNFINDFLIVKLCDRTDNLKKRIMENKLKKDYLKKSVEIIQFIVDNYKGDLSKIKQFVETQLFPYNDKLRKLIRFDLF